MFNDEILNERLRQIVFNITVNRKNSGYRLYNVFTKSFAFRSEQVDTTSPLRTICLDITNLDIYPYDECKVYDLERTLSEIKEENFHPELRNILENPRSDFKLTLRIANKTYSVSLNRLEFATVLKELQDMLVEYEDNLTYEVQRISETPTTEDSVENLDIKDPDC